MSASPTSASSRTGIERISAGKPLLGLATDAPAGQVWAYQICTPLQVGPTQVALSLNLRVCCNRIIDLEAAGDLLLVDSLRPLRVLQKQRLAQTRLMPHPRTGRMVHLSVGWPQGAFVPLGALRDDGSPHPHAGTGFLVITEHGYPASLADQPDTHIDLDDPDIYTGLHLLQVAFDGRQLHVTHTQSMEERDLIAGTHVLGLSMPAGIPDGDDLLTGINCGTFAAMAAGFLRWRRGGDGRWSIVDQRVVDERGTEPSLVRDPRDQSLLISARPSTAAGFKSPTPLAPTIHRSTDGGRTWRLVFRQNILMGNSPVKLHRALDGTLYLVANRYHEPRKNPLQKRDQLWLYPLSDDRTAVLEPLCVRDTRADFGPSPYPDSVWRIDHPIGANVRLADGQWRHLLTYRGLDDAEMRTDAGPTPWTGTYVEEVGSSGPPLPYWRF